MKLQSLLNILLVLLVGLLLTIFVSFFVPGSGEPTFLIHPQFDSLLQGSETLSERPGALVLGTLIALTMVSILGTFVLVGLQRPGQINRTRYWFIGGFAIYGLLFLMVIFKNTDSKQESTFLWGFPEATTWVIYGIWLFSLFFIFLYMTTFEKAILNRKDLESFREIQKKYQSRARRVP